jgi:hypothetical protein
MCWAAAQTDVAELAAREGRAGQLEATRHPSIEQAQRRAASREADRGAAQAALREVGAEVDPGTLEGRCRVARRSDELMDPERLTSRRAQLFGFDESLRAAGVGGDEAAGDGRSRASKNR